MRSATCRSMRAARRLVALFEKYRPTSSSPTTTRVGTTIPITYRPTASRSPPSSRAAFRPSSTSPHFDAAPSRQLRDELAKLGVEFPAPDLDAETLALMDAVERRITTTVDTTAFVEQKRRALAAHASQTRGVVVRPHPELRCSPTRSALEFFIRARDTTGAPVPEDDLLAGIRDAKGRD